MNDLFNAFGFLSQNVHIAGWFFLIMLAWRVSAKVTNFFAGIEDTAKETREAAERTKKMETTIEAVANNHLPHLQTGINEVNDTLKDLHRDILTILLSKAKE